MTEAIVYLNGRLVPQSRAFISTSNSSFLYGEGLFETLKIEKGRPRFLPHHLERLYRGAEFLNFSLPDQDALTKAIEETIEANGVECGRLRLTLSRNGEGSCLLITASQGLPYKEKDYLQGFRAVLSSFRRNHLSPLKAFKTTNYLENALALKEAQAAGAGEAILLNTEGFLAEGSRSNLFLVHDGVLFTPDLASGPLPGITRQQVIALAQQAGITVVEKRLALKDLTAAQEAFLTSSLMEIMPLTSFGDQPIGNGKPGPVTSYIKKIFTNTAVGKLSSPPGGIIK
ncbi:MAG: hypothetical protein PWP65_1582 [Clostridia bacterium]|nr:hypothetical protein [Clostridia bacterium]